MKIFIKIIILLILVKPSIAQNNGENKPIIISSKNINYRDSLLIKDLFLNGIREKISLHLLIAQDYFKRVLKIDHAHHPSMYELSQLAFQNKQFDVAKEYIEMATTLNADNQYYWLLAANIYQQQKEYTLLNYALDNLIRLQPNKTEYLFDKANALFNSNQLTEAIETYTKLENLDGLNDDILAAKQRVYLKTGEIDKAASDLKNLIKQDSTHIKYYILLAQLYHANDLNKEALQALLSALHFEEDNHEILLSIYDILKQDKKADQAFSYLEKAFYQIHMPIDQKVGIVVSYFDLFPDSTAIQTAKKLSSIMTSTHQNEAKAFSIHGDILFQNNELQPAAFAYEKAVQLNPSIYAVWDQLIRIYLMLNDYEKALTLSTKSLEYFPHQASLFYYKGVSYHQVKQYQSALINYEQAIALEADENTNSKSQIISAIADIHQQLKNYKKSEEHYNLSLNIQPNNPYTLNNYAYYLSLRNQDLDLAASMAKKANEIDPNNSSYEDTYAWVLFKQKKYDEAKIWMEKSIANSKEKSGILFEHYGDILYHLNDVSQAVENWKIALSFDPKNTLLKKKINDKKYYN